ncbi:MAG: hypothetical protein FWC53_03555 [Firmicutes bacterium]|nr:hypothetical protein [Bacillota bacterium]
MDIPIFDISNPVTLLLLLAVTVLLIFLGKEIKKPHAPAIPLIFFLLLIAMHSIQITQIPASDDGTIRTLLTICLGIDFVMVFVSFIGYLWIDDIATKFYQKKSVDNSLDWFWGKV